MELSIKFSKEELNLLSEALRIGGIHHSDGMQADKMLELEVKVKTIINLQYSR